MKDIAQFMMASADDEAASVPDGFDGQNIPAAIDDLITTPYKTPEQLAGDIVKLADDGKNGLPAHVIGVPNQPRAGTEAHTQEEYSQAVLHLQREAKQFMQTPPATRIAANIVPHVHPGDGDPRRSPWTAFVDDLVSHSQSDQ